MMWIWILFAIVLIALLVPLFNPIRGAQTRPPASSESKGSPQEILEERYARGEIDEEDFERRKRNLER